VGNEKGRKRRKRREEKGKKRKRRESTLFAEASASVSGS